MRSNMVFPYDPPEPELLQAIVRVAIAHSQLDYELVMLIRQLRGMTVADAQKKYKKAGSGQLREEIEKLIAALPTCREIQQYLIRAEELTERRNDCIHGIWGRELDGDDFIFRLPNGAEIPKPTAEELGSLASQLFDLIVEIQNSRMSMPR